MVMMTIAITLTKKLTNVQPIVGHVHKYEASLWTLENW